MRLIISLLTIFSFSLALAQDIPLVRPIKLAPRREIIPYNSAEQALLASRDTSMYYTPIREWSPAQGEAISGEFLVPFTWVNRDVILRVGAAEAPYWVVVNGRDVIFEQDSNSPADFNITDFVKEDINSLQLRFEPSSRVHAIEGWSTKLPARAVDVSVRSQPLLMVEDLFTRVSTSGVMISIALRNNMLNTRSARLNYTLTTPDDILAREGSTDVEIALRGADTLYISLPFDPDMAWSAENQRFYRLDLTMQEGGHFTEYHSYNLGFKLIENDGDYLKINGKRATLKVKKVDPYSVTREELKHIASEGYNTLRLSAGKYDRELIEFCDYTGLYVIASAPINSSHSGSNILRGGNPSNDPDYCRQYIERAEKSYLTTRSHPSVIAFSIADSSLNGNNLYESYLRVKELEHHLPIIYPEAAGEWNSDKLKLK